MNGRTRRLGRLLSPGGHLRMVPMDHGISMGAPDGLDDPAKIAVALAKAGATCFTAHRGLIPALAGAVGDAGLLLHLSASTDAAPDPNDKRLVATVEDALRHGCDGVSIHLNLGSLTEPRQLEEAGRVAGDCERWGMPLLAMVYPRGPNVKDPKDPLLVAHAARLAYELGCDVVKVPFTGTSASFARVVAAAPIPILAAGGPRDAKGFLDAMAAAKQGGARGFSAGRNLFAQPEGAKRMAALAKVFP